MNDAVLILASDDKPLVRSVEAALRKAGINCIAGDDGALANRQFEIHVSATDHPRALDIAGPVLARREKFRSFPPVRPTPEFPGSNTGGSIDGITGF
jgi:hypothetical protein